MSAFSPPASAGPDPAGPFAPDRRDWLRLLGGVLFASGAVVLVFRKQSDWGNWALFATVAIACLVLYAAAVLGRRAWPALQGWQSAFFVFAVILLPVSLLLFVQAVHGNTGDALNIFWIFGVCAAVAIATALLAGAWWQMLIGGIYVAISFVALGTKVINDHPNTVRWLLIVIALVLIAAAAVVTRMGRPQGADLITAGGIAAITAGLVSLAGLTSTSADLVGGGGGPRPTSGWNAYLLIVALLLLAYGARAATRGAAYVGAVGLIAFIVLAGRNVVAIENGDDVHTVSGWPLILLIVGAIALVVSFLLRPGMLGPAGPTTGPGGRLAGAGGAAVPGAPPSPAGGYREPGAPPAPPPEPGAPPPTPPPV